MDPISLIVGTTFLGGLTVALAEEIGIIGRSGDIENMSGRKLKSSDPFGKLAEKLDGRKRDAGTAPYPPTPGDARAPTTPGGVPAPAPPDKFDSPAPVQTPPPTPGGAQAPPTTGGVPAPAPTDKFNTPSPAPAPTTGPSTDHPHTTPPITPTRNTGGPISAGLNIPPPASVSSAPQVELAPSATISRPTRGERLIPDTFSGGSNLRAFQVSHANYIAQLGKYNTRFA